jgi:phosphopantothenoylcysteine decarboxylase/phosphopantothenate--cysteine ligase
LKRKHVDLIVANEVDSEQSGFGKDTSRAAIIGADGRVEELPLLSKEALAEALFDRIAALLPV